MEAEEGKIDGTDVISPDYEMNQSRESYLKAEMLLWTPSLFSDNLQFNYGHAQLRTIISCLGHCTDLSKHFSWNRNSIIPLKVESFKNCWKSQIQIEFPE